MNFSEKGWLRTYLYIRNNHILQREYQRISIQAIASHDLEQAMYQFVQSTGLMYGHPARVPFKYKSLARVLKVDDLSDANKIKIILVESFLNSALASPRYKGMDNIIDLADAILEAALHIGKFYKFLYPELDTKKGKIFRTERKGLELTEYILEKKLNRPVNVGDNFWVDIFNSSLLFIDMIYFGRWLHAYKTSGEVEQVKHQRDTARFVMLKLIAATAYADQIVDPEEKKLFSYFLKSTQLPEDKREEAQSYLEKGVEIDDLDFSDISSNVLKRYFLELAILTTCIDKEVSSSETSFLKELSVKLGFTSGELEVSTIAIESFMIEHWQQVNYLQSSHNFQGISKYLVQHLATITKKHAKKLSEAVYKDPELLNLLIKLRNDSLTMEEKKKVRLLLIELLNAIPPLQVVALPRTFLTLPVLTQILPKAVLEVKPEPTTKVDG